MGHLRGNITGPKIKMNIYAFGDIHGELFKLKSLMKRVFPEKGDLLVFLGDYIDRGKHSFEVIEYLIDLSYKYNCIFLKGNHEDMFLDYLVGIYQNIFIGNGGRKTIKSYYRNGFDLKKYTMAGDIKIPSAHTEFLSNLVNYYETEDYIFVHAGISPGIPMDKQDKDVLLWDRSFSSIDYKGKVVVYGHHPHKYVLNEKYKICIDTGVCFDDMGELTCVKLPERTFIKQGPVMEDIYE